MIYSQALPEYVILFFYLVLDRLGAFFQQDVTFREIRGR